MKNPFFPPFFFLSSAIRIKFFADPCLKLHVLQSLQRTDKIKTNLFFGEVILRNLFILENN